MRTYFYSIGENKFGPFSIEDLKNENINPESWVWYEGLADWKKASDIPELNVLFQKNETILRQEQVTVNSPDIKEEYSVNANFKSKLAKSIVATAICSFAFFFGIPAIINAAKAIGANGRGDHQAAQEFNKKAKKFINLTIIFGVILWVFYLVFIISMQASMYSGMFF